MRLRGYDRGMETKKRGKKKQLGGLMAMDTFGKRLRVLRQDRGLSQIDLRDNLKQYGVDIGETYISELERTDRMPALGVAAGMARVLNVSVDYLALLADEAKSYKVEPKLEYISPEADEVAQLIDEMTQEQRAMIVAMARGLASPLTEQRRMRASIKAMLESVEGNLGPERRKEFERILRERGISWDSGQV